MVYPFSPCRSLSLKQRRNWDNYNTKGDHSSGHISQATVLPTYLIPSYLFIVACFVATSKIAASSPPKVCLLLHILLHLQPPARTRRPGLHHLQGLLLCFQKSSPAIRRHLHQVLVTSPLISSGLHHHLQDLLHLRIASHFHTCNTTSLEEARAVDFELTSRSGLEARLVRFARPW